MNRNYREWAAGTRIINTTGSRGVFLAYWNGYAWILFDGMTSPVTVDANTLVKDE